MGVAVLVGVFVAVFVGVFVGVFGVLLAVFVGVLVDVLVGVFVGVTGWQAVEHVAAGSSVSAGTGNVGVPPQVAGKLVGAGVTAPE